jgi:16S rRNA (cytosine1402-N4)-methyltransferase
MPGHVPVLLTEVLEYLRPRPGGLYLDGTVGLGGHSRAVLESGSVGGLLGVERDAEALNLARVNLASFAERVVLKQGLYSRFDEYMNELGWPALDGAFIDIGVSSLQLDAGERGFSFMHDGPLDMRMSAQENIPSAKDLVNTADAPTLRRIIAELGEDPMAGRIAEAIVAARQTASIDSTSQLARIVEMAYPAKWRATARNHPATRTFQGLRMAVNNELDELRKFLQKIPQLLKAGGRVVVLTFHSLEDRLVKHSFRNSATGCLCPPQILQCVCEHDAVYEILTRRPVTAGADELANNPRAKSAKLRAARRI